MSEHTEVFASEPVEQPKVLEGITVSYLLEKIEAIRQDSEYLHQVVVELGNVHSEGPGDIGAAEQAKALGRVVEAREATHQKMLQFYQDLFESINPNPRPKATMGTRESMAAQMMEILRDPSADDVSRSYVSDILQRYMQTL